jgi:sugar O-acyltransferase (sialic acid O-acetyltransferase NeuD family)
VKRIIILGTGGNCIDILDTISDINSSCGTTAYECLGFLDDDVHKLGLNVFGHRVLGPINCAPSYDNNTFFVNGIGSPATFLMRPEITLRAAVPLERWATLIHPSSSVSRLSRLGNGVVIFQNVTITSNVTIGHHVLILPNSVISHDDVVGDYTLVAGGVCVSGGVSVGPSCYLGSNSALIGNITIGARTLIGMGAVVLHDFPEDSVVVGNPARKIRQSGAPSACR